MSALGSLVVKLGLEYAQFTGGLDKSEQAALAAAKRVQDTMDGIRQRAATMAGAVAGSLVAAFSVGAMKSFIGEAINVADEMSKLAQKTGLAVPQVAGLQLAFRQSGQGADAMQASLGRLSRGMAEGNKGLDAMGLSAKRADGTLKTTREMLGEVADKFASYADGAEKTALAQEIFGKSGAEMIPLLNAGAKALDEYDALARKLGLTLEESTAKEAEKFNDTLDLVGQGVKGVSMQVAAQLLPTLSGLAGQFLESMTSGDKLKRTADFLATGLKGLYVVGLGVVELFSSVGKVLGGVSAAVVAALSGDFSGAAGILRDMRADIGGSWQATLGEMQAAWNATGNAAVESMAATSGALKRTAPVVSETAKKAKEAADEFERLRDKITGKENGTDADFLKNLATLKKAYDDKRISLEQYLDLANKYVQQQKYMQDALKVEQQLAQLAADARNKEANAIAAAMEAETRAAEQSLASVVARTASLKDEEAALRLARAQNITLAEAVEQLTLARLKERQARFNDGSETWIQIEREIAARKELLDVMSTRALREREERGWSDMWQSIDRTAHDVWTNIWEGGSNVFKKLGQTIKATVLDLLYQLTVRPFIIQIGTSIFGSGFATAAAASGGGAGGASMLGGLGNVISNGFSLLTNGISSSIGNAFSSFATSDLGARLGLSSAVDYGTGYSANIMTPMGSNIGAGLGMAGNGLMGYGISRMLSGGYTTGGNTVNVIAGIASAFLGPIAGVVGGLINRLFGRKLADVGIEGTFGGDKGFQGQQYEFYKGGLLRSDKTKYSALDPEFEKALADTFKGMRAQVAFFADTLGLSTDRIEEYTTKIKISTQGLNAEQIQQKFAEALATANNELAEQVLGTWETTSETVMRTIMRTEGHGEDMVQVWEEVEETITKSTYKASEYAKEGEKAIETLTRLATSLTTVNGIFDTLGYSLLESSLKGADAASKIADAFGGLDNMVAATSSYFQNFYSEEERREVARRQMLKQLSEVGIKELPKTREDYRRLVEAQDLSTESGRKAYAMLVMLSSVFADLTVSAEDAAEAARQEARSKLDAAYSALERAIGVQRKAYEAQRTAATELARVWGTVAEVAGSAMRDLRGEVAATAQMQAARGMVFIEQALASARAGVAPDANALSQAIAAARSGLNANNYATQFELDRDRLVIAGQMEQLNAVAGKQKTAAEQQVESLDRLIRQGEETLDYWKQQIAIANGSFEAIVSVEEAIRTLQSLMFPDQGVNKPQQVGGGGTGGGAVWGPGGGGNGAAKDAKYKKVVSLGSAGVGYQPVIDEPTIARLDSLSGIYHQFDGTGDLRGLLDAIKGAGGSLQDLHLLSGYFESDWEKAAASVGIPAFARGGMHAGGWALVGEEGPELAYLPPARIYSASATRGMQAGGVSAGDGSMAQVAQLIAAAMTAVRDEIKIGNGHAKKSADALEGASEGGALRTTPA